MGKKYYLDTEFNEDGSTIDLISIGLVCEDGREYYACNTDAQLHRCNLWVRKNVLPHLPSYGDVAWKRKKDIARDVLFFVESTKDRSQNEFYGYFADYDWVVLAQLFGPMSELPPQFPYFCMDLKQLSVMLGNPEHPKQESVEHNALNDARWNKLLHEYLNGLLKIRTVGV